MWKSWIIIWRETSLWPGLSVSGFVCHNFLKWRQVSLPRSYRILSCSSHILLQLRSIYWSPFSLTAVVAGAVALRMSLHQGPYATHVKAHIGPQSTGLANFLGRLRCRPRSRRRVMRPREQATFNGYTRPWPKKTRISGANFHGKEGWEVNYA